MSTAPVVPRRRPAWSEALSRAVQPPSSPVHSPVAALLIASAPLSLILLTYAVGDWIDSGIHIDSGGPRGSLAGLTNRLGFELHTTAAATADRQVFGVVPSVWGQQRWLDGSAHWWDAVATLIYATHFVAIPLVTVLVWLRHRDRYRAWLAAFLSFTGLGVAGYVVYPAAPPWLAADRGLIGPVERTSDLGWDYLHLEAVGRLVGAGQSGSNPVAAMPSLHAGGAMLVALFLWPVVTRLWRTALVAYVVLMAVVLVYTGEHYVLDVVVGWAVAGAAVAIGATTRRTARDVVRSGDSRDEGHPVGGGAPNHGRRRSRETESAGAATRGRVACREDGSPVTGSRATTPAPAAPHPRRRR